MRQLYGCAVQAGNAQTAVLQSPQGRLQNGLVRKDILDQGRHFPTVVGVGFLNSQYSVDCERHGAFGDPFSSLMNTKGTDL